jgi:hypothetical protein
MDHDPPHLDEPGGNVGHCILASRDMKSVDFSDVTSNLAIKNELINI